MKIRHKQSGVELEGEFEFTDTDFMENSDGRWQTTSCYSKAQWEEVKPKWVDVTAECGVTKDGLTIEHGMLALATVLSTERYRLRKVQVRQLDSDPVLGFQRTGAFIIEQRQA